MPASPLRAVFFPWMKHPAWLADVVASELYSAAPNIEVVVGR
jgi:hypothetical protein